MVLTKLKLHQASKDARSDDTGALKTKSLLYVLEDPEKDALVPPILPNHRKELRGINHPAMRGLVAPRSLLDEHEEDLEQ